MSVEPGNRGQTESRDSVREPLTTMALVIVVLLLVACANVANLMLARGRARVGADDSRDNRGRPRAGHPSARH